MTDIVEKTKGTPFLKAIKGRIPRWGYHVDGLTLELRKHSVAWIWKWEVVVFNSETHDSERRNFRKLSDAFAYFKDLVSKHEIRLVEAKGQLPAWMQEWVDEHLEDEIADES